MPMTGAFEAVVEVALMTMVEEPSRLPMVLPTRLPTSKTPDVVPSEMPMNGELAAVVKLRLARLVDAGDDVPLHAGRRAAARGREVNATDFVC